MTEINNGKKAGRVVPRVSKATGGLLAGIEITRYSDVQAIDDLAYAERLKRGFDSMPAFPD